MRESFFDSGPIMCDDLCQAGRFDAATFDIHVRLREKVETRRHFRTSLQEIDKMLCASEYYYLWT